MRVVIAGASGFLGTHLSDHLRVHGHEVTALVRREPGSAHESCWDPAAGRMDAAVIESADAVVNLAGAPIAGNPHSKKWAREVLESRVSTTRLLAETIAATERPAAFLAGNGIAWYGDHGAAPVTEETESRGDAFLTRVSREWQAATSASSPASSPASLTICHAVWRERRVPRALRNRAPAGADDLAFAAMLGLVRDTQAPRAVAAWEPNGTIRSFPPLP